MTQSAAEVLKTAARRLSPGPDANPLLPRIAAGREPRAVFAAFALEQHHIIASDLRSFRHLAQRAGESPPVAAFFASLAQGEVLALEKLSALSAACGLTDEDVSAYEPRPGCQAYPAFAAWLALGAEPADAVIALTANFAAWGGYCRTVARAMREHYAFPDAACAFFDFFAAAAPDLADQARAAVQHGLDTGLITLPLAHRYGRLLQAYEQLFWTTLAAPSPERGAGNRAAAPHRPADS